MKPRFKGYYVTFFDDSTVLMWQCDLIPGMFTDLEGGCQWLVANNFLPLRLL